MTILATFNCENLFGRYKFEAAPGGSKNGVLTPHELEQHWGFLPPPSWRNSFQFFNKDWRTVTAAVLKGVGVLPEIACVQEVENLEALRRFNTDFLQGQYKYAVVIESHDPRGIDVAVLSQHPLTDLRSHVDETVNGGAKNDWVFSRDCLEVTVDVGGKPLHLFVNHLKSKLARSQKERENADKRRLAQADAVSRIVKQRFGNGWKNENLAVVGDFNDQPTSPFLKPLLDMGFVNVLDQLPADQRWTHFWASKNLVAQLDYILLTPSLAQKVQGLPYVERRGLIRKPNKKAYLATADDRRGAQVPLPNDRFAGVTATISASDHCPVMVNLSL